MAAISLSNRRRRCLCGLLCFHSGFLSLRFNDSSIIPTMIIHPLDAWRLMLSVIQRFDRMNPLTTNWHSPPNMEEGQRQLSSCLSFDMTTGGAYYDAP